MSTLDDLREGLGQAWDAVVAGWREFSRRASPALTRFSPSGAGDDVITRDETEAVMRSAGWGVLAAEVFDDDARVLVRIEVPGMEREDFSVEVDDGVLVVQGEKRSPHAETRGRYHVLECAYGRFERAIALPAPVDPDAAKATYRKGVLTIELPKLKPEGERSIRVRIR